MYCADAADVGRATPKSIALVRNCVRMLRAIKAYRSSSTASRSTFGLNPWSHWRERVSILGPPQSVRSALLPAAFAHVVANGIAQIRKTKRIVLAQILSPCLPITDYQFSLIVELFSLASFGYDDCLAMGNQRIICSITNVRLELGRFGSMPCMLRNGFDDVVRDN